jgi:anti-sigma factor RsiW
MSDELPITDADLQAYADGRLGEARKSEIESWLATRPEEAERIATYRQLGDDLRSIYDPLLAEAVPARLQRAVRGGARWRQIGVVAAWLIIGAALGTLAGWQLHALRPGPVPVADATVMARRAAIAHATYSPEVRHPVEVGADQEQHLVAWLSKRLGVKVQAPKLEAAGMSLVGGRLLPGDRGPVAQFMYQTQSGRRLTLYVRAEDAHNRETAFRYARENNVGVFYWIDRDCGYALASADLDKEELLRVATMVYKQLEP